MNSASDVRGGMVCACLGLSGHCGPCSILSAFLVSVCSVHSPEDGDGNWHVLQTAFILCSSHLALTRRTPQLRSVSLLRVRLTLCVCIKNYGGGGVE